MIYNIEYSKQNIYKKFVQKRVECGAKRAKRQGCCLLLTLLSIGTNEVQRTLYCYFKISLNFISNSVIIFLAYFFVYLLFSFAISPKPIP